MGVATLRPVEAAKAIGNAGATPEALQRFWRSATACKRERPSRPVDALKGPIQQKPDDEQQHDGDVRRPDRRRSDDRRGSHARASRRRRPPMRTVGQTPRGRRAVHAEPGDQGDQHRRPADGPDWKLAPGSAGGCRTVLIGCVLAHAHRGVRRLKPYAPFIGIVLFGTLHGR